MHLKEAGRQRRYKHQDDGSNLGYGASPGWHETCLVRLGHHYYGWSINPPDVPPPRLNKALLRAYEPLASLTKALLKPYFWGGVKLGWGWLINVLTTHASLQKLRSLRAPFFWNLRKRLGAATEVHRVVMCVFFWIEDVVWYPGWYPSWSEIIWEQIKMISLWKSGF